MPDCMLLRALAVDCQQMMCCSTTPRKAAVACRQQSTQYMCSPNPDDVSGYKLLLGCACRTTCSSTAPQSRRSRLPTCWRQRGGICTQSSRPQSSLLMPGNFTGDVAAQAMENTLGPSRHILGTVTPKVGFMVAVEIALAFTCRVARRGLEEVVGSAAVHPLQLREE